MGTYLSTPILDKCREEGEFFTKTKIPLSWGVVDMQGWRKTMEDAHVVETDVVCPHDNDDIFPETAKVFAVFDGHGGAEVARFCQLYLVSVLTNQQEWRGVSCNVDVGKALVNCFHELDNMLDNSLRRDEIERLGLRKPALGERRYIEYNKMSLVAGVSGATEFIKSNIEEIPNNDQDLSFENVTGKEGSEISNLNGRSYFAEEKSESNINTGSSSKHLSLNKYKRHKDDTEKISDHIDVGILRDGEIGYKDDTMDRKVSLSNEDTFELSEKILTVTRSNPNASSVPVIRSPDNDMYSDTGIVSCYDVSSLPNQNEIENKNSAVRPTKILNGRQVCNLPDHPINAGCTSICAVIVGVTLTVANAGDSRAVLCRAGGMAEPLSFDHKPLHETEMKRITDAGGFVNHFGRVNGNLNLSRSIGDLKYKQTPRLPPSAQMITAEPDIIQITLLSSDEFIILACDGVWDCLSNEEAVRYVYEHIDSKTPTIIGIELLDKIVSADPRASQGIGGDNMTLMIVDLLPKKRSYRYRESADKSINADCCG